MFRCQLSIGLLPLILIVSPDEVELRVSQVDFVEISNGIFRYQVNNGLLPLILIISENDVVFLSHLVYQPKNLTQSCFVCCESLGSASQGYC